MTPDSGQPSSQQVRLRALRGVAHCCDMLAGQSFEIRNAAAALVASSRHIGLDAQLVSVDAPDSAHGVAAWERRFPASSGPRWLGASSKLHHWLRTSAGAGEIGMLHAHGAWNMASVYPGWVAKWNWTPLVANPMGMLSGFAFERYSRIGGAFWRFVQRPALRAATCLQAATRDEAADLRRLGMRQPIALIPRGTRVAEPKPDRSGPLSVVCCGDFSLGEAAAFAARACIACLRRTGEPRPDFRFIARGTVGDLDKWSQGSIARSLRETGVSISESAPLADPLDAYAGVDIALPVGDAEIATALASGTPAIVVGQDSWRRIEMQRAGWWCEPSAESLERTIASALSLDRRELDAMGDAGRRWMSAERAWPKIARDTLLLYDWIVSGMPEKDRHDWIIAAEPDETARQAEEEGHC